MRVREDQMTDDPYAIAAHYGDEDGDGRWHPRLTVRS